MITNILKDFIDSPIFILLVVLLTIVISSEIRRQNKKRRRPKAFKADKLRTSPLMHFTLYDHQTTDVLRNSEDVTLCNIDNTSKYVEVTNDKALVTCLKCIKKLNLND